MEKVQQIAFRAMGSQMLAAVESYDPQARSMLAEVPGWFEGWEQSLSRFKEDSELSRINHTGRSTLPIPVSDTFWTVLQLALQAAHFTGGLVTPTVLNALESAGYDKSFDDIKGKETTRNSASGAQTSGQARPVANWHKIRAYPETHSVRLPAGVRLDFGGIAKGWAADEAVNRLAKHGPALVNAGGDIAVSGPTFNGAGWLIGIDAPDMPHLPPDAEPNPQLELLAIRSGGVATSGRDYRRWQQGGEWRHHIIDPRTGTPATTDVLAATVIAPTACAAEIAAKVIMLLGSTEGLEWLEDRPSLAGLIVLEDGQVVRSKRLKNYIWSDSNGK